MNPDAADHLLRIGSASAGAVSGAAAGAASSWAMLIFGVPLAVVFAAFSGAMVSLTFMPASTAPRTLAIVASGTLAGAYMAAFAAEWLHLTPAAMGGAAFLVGGTLQWAVPVLIEQVGRWKK